MTIDCHNWGIETVNARMCVEGCDLVEIAEEYGTPLFVVNEARLRRNCKAIKKVFETFDNESSVFFSYKTNSVPEILKIIHEEGLGAEVISEFELDLAEHLGVAPSQIAFDAIYKTDVLLEKLVRRNIKIINIDSAGEVETLNRLAEKYDKKIDVGVRLHTKTGWGKNPFGILAADILDIFEQISNKPYLVPAGLHVHSSSWAASARDYISKARWLVDLCERLKDKLKIEIKYIDLGGGYGCPTTRKLGQFEHLFNARLGLNLKPPNVERFVPLAKAIKTVHEEIKNLCDRKGLSAPSLYIEPGMSVVADTQLLLTRVSAVKKISGQHIVVTDAGMMNMAQPLRTEYHELFVVNRINESRKRFYKIVGRMCSPSDWLYQKKKLPEVEVGDVLAIMDTGAYFNALSNNFSFPRPPVVSVCNAKTRLMRRGEDFDHMTALDKSSY